MSCLYPLPVKIGDFNPVTGKSKRIFLPREKRYLDAYSMRGPCGRCIKCRLKYSRDWAIRIMHEAQVYDMDGFSNSFVTLTYNDANLPPNGSLVKKDMTDFIKRLRERLRNKIGCPIRYFYCGEYGETTKRPHYHICLFGYDFPDRIFYKKNELGDDLFYSPFLESVWPFGFNTVGSLTFDSAAYCARYILKKRTGDKSWLTYNDVDFDTGELINIRLPEYSCPSRRPGIGSEWFNRFGSDVFPADEVIFKNRRVGVPRFYSKLYELSNPLSYEAISELRAANAKKLSSVMTEDRLTGARKCFVKRVSKLIRPLE